MALDARNSGLIIKPCPPSLTSQNLVFLVSLVFQLHSSYQTSPHFCCNVCEAGYGLSNVSISLYLLFKWTFSSSYMLIAFFTSLNLFLLDVMTRYMRNRHFSRARGAILASTWKTMFWCLDVTPINPTCSLACLRRICKVSTEIVHAVMSTRHPRVKVSLQEHLNFLLTDSSAFASALKY